ncbi:transposase [Candidatus Cardinium hertigii]
MVKSIVTKGKATTRWFYTFKLHFIVNELKETRGSDER